MASVLVTGANGFLGSWLVRGLLHEGHQVRILVRASSDVSELEGLQYERARGDVTDEASLVQALDGIDTVFHLAGVVAYKKADRPLMEKVNVGGTACLLSAMKKTGVRRLVHLSSVVAVGAGFRPEQVLDENSPFNLSHLNLGYFETKRAAEQLVIQAFERGDVDPVILNPSTIYGPGDAKKGSRKTQVKVARGEFPFYTSGGVNVIHVEDCVAGILAGWKRGRIGQRYILCGENLTIRQLFQTIADCAGVAAPRWRLPRAALFALGGIGDFLTAIGLKGGVSLENAWTSQLFHWFDNSKARQELGLNPRPAREAIAASVAWMKQRGLA